MLARIGRNAATSQRSGTPVHNGSQLVHAAFASRPTLCVFVPTKETLARQAGFAY